MAAPINGTEQRLDAVLAELRAIRALLERPQPTPPAVALKEPARTPRGKKD